MEIQRGRVGFSAFEKKRKRQEEEEQENGCVYPEIDRKHYKKTFQLLEGDFKIRYRVQTRISRRLAATKQSKPIKNASIHPKTNPAAKSITKFANNKTVTQTRQIQETHSPFRASKHSEIKEERIREPIAGSVSAISSRILEKIESSMEKMDSSMMEMKSMTTELLELLSPRFCGICMETKINREMFESTCPHSYCLRCIRSHVSAKIHDNIEKVNCPDPSCDVTLEPRNCRSFVPRSVVKRWEIMICESEVGPEKIYCPFRDCLAVLDVEDRDGNVTSAECPHCHRLFNWERIMDKKFMKIARREKWQKCPGCKFYVQRSSGCESIKCRCGYHFCYVCGKNWMSGHLCRIAV